MGPGIHGLQPNGHAHLFFRSNEDTSNAFEDEDARVGSREPLAFCCPRVPPSHYSGSLREGVTLVRWVEVHQSECG